MSTTTIVPTRAHIRPARRGDLICHLPGQFHSRPQPRFIALDMRDGELWADYNPEVDDHSVPAEVYLGHIRRFPLTTFSVGEANRIMRAILSLAQRAVDGYESRWDGSTHVPQLTGDAEEALREIAELINSEG